MPGMAKRMGNPIIAVTRKGHHWTAGGVLFGGISPLLFFALKLHFDGLSVTVPVSVAGAVCDRQFFSIFFSFRGSPDGQEGCGQHWRTKPHTGESRNKNARKGSAKARTRTPQVAKDI